MFYVLYFLEMGLSLTQIGILLGILSTAQIIFEIPTGAIADIYGRKFSVILGNCLTGSTIIGIMFVKNFWLLCGLYFLWGASFTLTSGSYSAWFVDLLKKNKKGKKMHDVNSFQSAFASVGVIFAGIIAALLVKYFGLIIIWSFSGIAYIVAGIMLLFAKSDNIAKKKFKLINSWQITYNQIKNSGKEIWQNDNLFYLILAGCFCVMAIIFAGDLTFYPLIKSAGFPDHYFGYLISLCFSFGLFIPFVTKKMIDKMGGTKKYLIGILSLLVLFTIPIIWIKSLYGYIILFMIGYWLFLFYGPARFTLFQSFVPSEKRATIDSVRSMAYALVIIIITPLVGLMADNFGSKITIFIGGILFIPAIVMYLKVKGEGKKHL
jgi:MFS family permease